MSCNCPTPPGPPIPPFIPSHYGLPMTPIYVDTSMSIPGAAAEASTLGKLLKEKADAETLSGVSVHAVNGKMEIDGFMDAEVGSVPVKTEDGISWESIEESSGMEMEIEVLQTAIGDLTEIIESLTMRVDSLTAKVESFEG